MTSKEARALTKKWLKEKGFKQIKISGRNNNFIHPMGAFNVYVTFYKPWFDDCYNYEVGCYFDECEYGGVTIRVLDLPSNPNQFKGGISQGFYYGELTEEQYLQLLDEMFDKYLKPYYEKGAAYLKEILLNGDHLFERDAYWIEKYARRKMNELFGSNTGFD